MARKSGIQTGFLLVFGKPAKSQLWCDVYAVSRPLEKGEKRRFIPAPFAKTLVQGNEDRWTGTVKTKIWQKGHSMHFYPWGNFHTDPSRLLSTDLNRAEHKQVKRRGVGVEIRRLFLREVRQHYGEVTLNGSLTKEHLELRLHARLPVSEGRSFRHPISTEINAITNYLRRKRYAQQQQRASNVKKTHK